MTFSGKKGKIAVDFIGQTLDGPDLSVDGPHCGEHSFAASMVGGVQLDDATRFWEPNPPYTAQSYAPVSISSLTKMTISMKFTLADSTLTVLKSDAGAQQIGCRSTAFFSH